MWYSVQPLCQPTNMTPPDPIPREQEDRLVTELNNLRDALVQLALVVRDYMCEQDSAQRDQADCEAHQAIERAKSLACEPPRKL